MNSVHALQPVSVPEEAPRSDIETSIRLQNLIPIVMVIVGGCESCAEKMVERALQEGSTTQEVDKTLRIVAGTQKLGCFASAVGPAVIARMEKPLNAGLAALQKAISFMPKETKGEPRGVASISQWLPLESLLLLDRSKAKIDLDEFQTDGRMR